jgi:bifunctional non-homologous end joining protein LigD
MTKASDGRFGVRISNEDRLLFPDIGISKGALADYYARIAPIFLQVAARRPVTLVRCPDGITAECFFQKHDPGGLGEHVHHVPVSEKVGSTADYLWLDDPRGVLACVQMGTIEFHGWGSRVELLEMPDRMVFDLDPDEGLGWNIVKKAANRLKQELAEIGLVSFAMLSGGKGIHVVVPLDASAAWPKVKDFAERFSRNIAGTEPGLFTANIRKKDRTGRIFLDWLRNQRGATAVLPYSVRARDRAPVATPIDWSELDTITGADAFTIKDANALIKRAANKDLACWGEAEQALPGY